MADNNFKGTVEALFTGIDGVVSSKTVVGDAIHIGDTIILPLVDVSFAIGAGAFNADKKENIKNQDTITKILDMVPDMVDKFTGGKDSKLDENDVKDILDSVDVQ